MSTRLVLSEIEFTGVYALTQPVCSDKQTEPELSTTTEVERSLQSRTMGRN
jgi:hypothetical protein